MNRPVFLLLALTAIAPIGCTMAPKYARPAAPVPAEWPSGPAYAPAGPTNAPALADVDWQEFFTDEKLRQVIGLALTNNRDLRVAALNVERARAYYGIARSELYPVVNATGSGSKARVPADLSSTGKSMTKEQ